MAFACQRNSYLKELLSKVLSCTKVVDGYEVVLNDTVLFPEGGGQPGDEGTIGDVAVKNVFRRGPHAVHLTTQEVEVGQEYLCNVDWTRRSDHMQQHSGQHLLSAIADKLFNFKTVSWDLGKCVSHVELNTAKIEDEQCLKIEQLCNEMIRQHRPVTVHYLTKEESLKLKEVKTRGLPDDVIEPIRVVEIEDVEINMCCGTHVDNLSYIQVIKLLHTESMRGGTRLFFIAGDRVLNYLSSTIDVERKLTKLLSCGRDEHAQSVDKQKNNLRLLQKSCRNNLKEIAKYEATELSRAGSKDGYIFKHREDGDMDYIFAVMNSLDETAKTLPLFICAGNVKTGGQFVLRVTDEKMNDTSNRICDLIGGKGGGKKGQFQGKASNYKNLKDVHSIVKDLSVTVN